MASIEDLITRTCIVWSTERPLYKRPRKSPIFNLLNTDCHFELSYYCNQYSLYLNHYRSEWYGITLTVHFENRKGRALPLSSRTIMTQQTFEIWKCTKFDIVKLIPNFYEDNLMIFSVGIDENYTFRNALQRIPRAIQESVQPDETKMTKNEANHVKTEDQCTQTLIYPDACLQNLSADLSNMLDIDTNYDVQLNCGDRTLKAHSVVLQNRSEVFKAMLQRDMADVWTGIVSIHNMDFKLLEHFIGYLYTGMLPELTTEIATRLYETGNCYAVKALTRRCSTFLAQNILPENACEMLVLADTHKDQLLKDFSISYILAENIVLQDDQWLPFCDSHPKLALEVFNHSRKAPQ